MEIIFVWMIGALILGQMLKTLSLPPLIGFIFAGYIFNLIGFSDSQNILDIPSEIGVELLLFSLGLKIKPNSFLNKDLISVFFIHAASITLIYFFLLNISINFELKLLLCIALTFSSTIIASKSLEARKELNTFHGRISIVILVFQDVLALCLLVYMKTDDLSINSLYLLLLPFFIPLLKIFLSKLSSSEELELIAAIVIALFFGATLFKSFGFTGEIGALSLGILLSNYKSAERLADKIWSIRELLLLAFFVSLGMKININYEILINSVLILGYLILKMIFLFFLLILFRLRAYTAFLISISLSSYSEFLLIIIDSWLETNLISNDIFNVLICSVCLSFIFSSILNKYVHEIYVVLESFLIRLERKTHHPDEEPHTCGDSQVMILGMGRVGNAIFENLVKNNFKVVGFDADTDLIREHLKDGKRVTFADAEDPGFWSKLRFGKLRTIILALPEFRAQNWSIQQARKYGFVGKILVPTRLQGDPALLKESGADEIYDAYEAAGIGVTEILLKDKQSKPLEKK